MATAPLAAGPPAAPALAAHAEPPQPLFQLRGVGVCYPAPRRRLCRVGTPFWALSELSCDVRRGEVLGVIGRNGTGKSTLLRLLAGILAPDRGSLVSTGASASLLSLKVGFAPHLTGRENVFLSGLLLGLSRAEIRARMDAIVDFAELRDWIDRPLASYSSGMAARLGFATAFQIDPEVLLIDEVLGVGDAAFTAKSGALLRERLRAGKTAVLVSHNLAAVRELCDRVLWLEGGLARAEGKTDTVLAEYESCAQREARRGRGAPGVAR
jgi:lipopolysaccharide transport system ATP-binding protein